MMSLFSSFDLIIFYKSMLIIFIPFSFFLSNFYKVNIMSTLMISMVGENLTKFFYSLKPNSFNKFSSLIILTMLMTVFFLNFMSVFSFTFPLPSQFGSIMSLALTFWSSLLLINFFKNTKGFFSHFVPEGTPALLVVFLFLIELISNIIRPLTLTVRLVANILAGHLLMILLSNLVLYSPFMFPSYFLLNGIELVVAMIQAYIFSTMITLYFSEVH